MALSSAVVWEVRTDGSDTNGGGFKAGASGTDWTQQAAAQYSVTDAVTNGTTTITSATANFGTDVVGNVLYIQGGTGSITAGWYEITARSSSTSITVDRSTGLTTGTGATLKIGGALASSGLACGQVADGNIVYLKYNATPYSITSSTPRVSGGLPHFTDLYSFGGKLIGYDTTRTVTNTDANRPTLLVVGLSSITVVNATSTWHTHVRNIIVDGDGNSSIVGFGTVASRPIIERCKAVDCTTGFNGGNIYRNCQASGGTTGFAGGGTYVACVANGNTTGFDKPITAVGCIAYGCSGDGFTGDAFGSSYHSCTSYGNGGDGFDMNNTGTYSSCLAYGNTGYGFRSSGTVAFLTGCAAGSNTAGASTGTITQVGSLVSVTADPFTNAAGGDFSLNNTAGGGAACRAAGFPGVFPGGTTTGYLDIGAVQHQDSPASNNIIRRIRRTM